MEKFILKLREKPENERKKILTISLIVCMVIITGIWIYSLTHRFSSNTDEKVVTEEKDDTKPIKLLGSRFKDMYENMRASVGQAKIGFSKNEDIRERAPEEKVVNLIPVYK